MKWLFEHTAKFPRHERFRMAKRIDVTLFDFHKTLVIAAQSPSTKQHLQQADILLNLLRTYLRLAVEMGYTTPRQFKYASEFTVEIGKMLGAWLKKA